MISYFFCVVPLFIATAKGKTAVFERKTVTCLGGKAVFGFGQFPNYPDGIEYFLTVSCLWIRRKV
ncbi:DUF169 domain-containing protein [Terrisporobacter vanillatitrophus]|uniref:DUF169 domain-containing protein n=1 Tax=Terrisporobacter vanillatitrophus TaxID=3058402 RepID=UPI003EBEA521